MQRRRPLRRTRLEQRSSLRPDPEKVREFLNRDRKPLKKTPLRTGSKPRREAEGPLTPREWQLAVFVASEGRCIVSRSEALSVDDRGFQAHHPLPKRVLRARGLFDRVWDSRNGVWVRTDVHERHTGAVERIPAEVLPASVWAFCRELDALEGTEWATQLVLREHPPAGSSRSF